jgi:hypothetical protein
MNILSGEEIIMFGTKIEINQIFLVEKKENRKFP